MTHWQEIRANWVNGNLTDAKEQLSQMPTQQALTVVLEAIASHYAHSDPKTGTHSGDLQDLFEILRAIKRG